MTSRRDKLPPIDSDLRATLTQLNSAGANADGKGITFTKLTAYLKENPPKFEMNPEALRNLLLRLRKCVDAGLAEVVRSPGNNGNGEVYFCLTQKGEGYVGKSNPPPGYSWPETRYSASQIQRLNGRVPQSMGER